MEDRESAGPAGEGSTDQQGAEDTGIHRDPSAAGYDGQHEALREPSASEGLQDWFGELFGQALDVVWRPSEFFASSTDDGGLGRPTVFALVMGAIAGVLGFVLRVLPGFGAVFSTPLAAFTCSVVGAFVIHVLAMVAGGRGSLEGSYRLAAYLMVFFPLIVVSAVLPYLEVAMAGWGLYVLLMGVVPIHRLDERRAWSVFGTVGALALLVLLVSTLTDGRSTVLDELDRLRAQQQRVVRDLERRIEALRSGEGD
jgi:hypothetical protein